MIQFLNTNLIEVSVIRCDNADCFVHDIAFRLNFSSHSTAPEGNQLIVSIMATLPNRQERSGRLGVFLSKTRNK